MRRAALEKIFIPSTVDPINLGRLLGQFWEAIRKVVEPLLANPRSDSSIVTTSLQAAVQKTISHKLTVTTGKTPEGWQVTDITSAATVHRVDWDDKTITLLASANCEVQIEVW